jgi:hypothetical protein
LLALGSGNSTVAVVFHILGADKDDQRCSSLSAVYKGILAPLVGSLKLASVVYFYLYWVIIVAS